MLSVFGDESTDESKQRVFAVAGVIGPDNFWDVLEGQWIDRTGGVPFHANNCDSDQGDYKNIPHAENKKLYEDLTQLLANSGLCAWGLTIDLVAQKQVFPDAPDIAYYKCFTEVLGKMTQMAVSLSETVKFSFDSRKESEYNAGMLYGMYRDRQECRHHLFPEISFLCSRDHPKIQVADLVARENMKAIDNTFGPVKRPPRRSWMALYETTRFRVECLGLQWFESLKSQMSSIEEATGINGKSYRAWLKENNLQHNTTNLFRFGDYNKMIKECEGKP